MMKIHKKYLHSLSKLEIYRMLLEVHYLRILSFVLATVFAAIGTELNAQRLSRDLNVDLLINQAGYMPNAEKVVVTQGEVERNFEVVDITSMDVVYSGSLKPVKGDFGYYLSGTFTDVTKEGHYYLTSDTLRSYPFKISSTAYEQPIDLIVQYFSRQRCGPSPTGYLSPCHIDDGIRIDNGKHQDVSGGWHDASDLRKWVSATIYGMVGLAKTYELLEHREKEKIVDELLWGNRYFLNMQEAEGYIMNYVGGDVKKHSDSNRWTDNTIGEEGGELDFVKPTTGTSTSDMLLFGSNDDRVIRTDPLDMTGQYNFITSEAIMARIMQETDSEYAQKCLQAGKRCYDWCIQQEADYTPGTLGASIQAATELYKTTGMENYKDFAVVQAKLLNDLQVNNQGESVSGFFHISAENHEPYKNIWHGHLELISVCDLITLFPDHEDIDIWENMISNYSVNYLSFMAGKNSFNIIPFGLYNSEDPGGNRKVGNYWYRYFMQPEQEWWVGINANIASAGIGLLKAANIVDNPSLRMNAQRQLDWIIGSNPFNSSTLVSIGHNHPKHFPGSTFIPRTPVIPGAVLNGLGGDHMDQPTVGNGNWQISEYWTPMVAYTLWLMAELSAAD